MSCCCVVSAWASKFKKNKQTQTAFHDSSTLAWTWSNFVMFLCSYFPIFLGWQAFFLFTTKKCLEFFFHGCSRTNTFSLQLQQCGVATHHISKRVKGAVLKSCPPVCFRALPTVNHLFVMFALLAQTHTYTGFRRLQQVLCLQCFCMFRNVPFCQLRPDILSAGGAEMLERVMKMEKKYGSYPRSQPVTAVTVLSFLHKKIICVFTVMLQTQGFLSSLCDGHRCCVWTVNAQLRTL